MSAHQRRDGALIISYSCKEGKHREKCDAYVAELFDVIVCHCTCHPACGRPACKARRQASFDKGKATSLGKKAVR